MPLRTLNSTEGPTHSDVVFLCVHISFICSDSVARIECASIVVHFGKTMSDSCVRIWEFRNSHSIAHIFNRTLPHICHNNTSSLTQTHTHTHLCGFNKRTARVKKNTWHRKRWTRWHTHTNMHIKSNNAVALISPSYGTIFKLPR